jgi:hypothetical protein
MKKKKIKKKGGVGIFRILFLFVIAFSIPVLVYVFFILKPSNDKNWEVGFEKLPKFEIQNNIVKIKDFRDYHYSKDKFVSANYVDRTVDVNKLERVWFVLEPFDANKYIKFDGIAHTYFVFDFKDSDPVGISVEARREKGEVFNLVPGLFNQFELMYVWASEGDLTGRRVLVGHNKVYMFPLTIKNESAKKLFFQLVNSSHSLETTPRFYNSLTSNCTNELAKVANQVKKNSIPLSYIWLFPGFSAKELYRLKFIPTDKPYEEIQKKYDATALVEKYAGEKNMSELIRKELLK